MICEARLVNGLSDADVREMFNGARTQDYEALATEVRALAAVLDTIAGSSGYAEARTKLGRLRSDTDRVVAIDFFGADGRETTDGLLTGLESKLLENDAVQENAADDAKALRGRVWVTRQGVHVDRMASVWLIRRFIDPDAQFKFVPAKGYLPSPGELRFDMFEAEFTHQGDRCTFEVLTALAGPADAALAAIGEIVHDIDLKDAKFGREEASGIARVMDGIAAASKDDNRRIERASALFDDLYEFFRTAKR
jgi:hypothetical protein